MSSLKKNFFLIVFKNGGKNQQALSECQSWLEPQYYIAYLVAWRLSSLESFNNDLIVLERVRSTVLFNSYYESILSMFQI